MASLFGSPAGTHGAMGSLKSHPVTPDLLYSVVASAVSLSRGVSPAPVLGQDNISGNASASVLTELLSLTQDVDFGPIVTPVSVATHANNPNVVPYDSKIIDGHVGDVDVPHSASNSHLPSTVARATLEMSTEELVTLACHYEAMAHEAMAEEQIDHPATRGKGLILVTVVLLVL
ncbi:hypothetical protein B0H13DRAFT_2382839 [Mycena leptocephala]|nr:hypothetical protein B0H13DRAFT_2382839 [Mycena leptocephala]